MCWFKKSTTTSLPSGCKINRRGIPGLPSDLNHTTAVGVVIDECKRVFGQDKESAILNAIKNITVEWWNDVAPHPSTGVLDTVVVDNDQIYSGLTVGYTCKVAWRGKMSRSAFGHEILHVMCNDILHDPDANHTNPAIWGAGAEGAIGTALDKVSL